MYSVVIIDDDPMSQLVLKDLLAIHTNEFEISGIYAGVEESLEALSNQNPDLVFLDMELPDGQGFDVLKRFNEISFEVIITTIHDSFMLEAIKHSAIDYLMKPVEKKELASALERFKKRAGKLIQRNAKPDSLSSNTSRLVVPNQNGLALVNIKELIRLESDGAYTRLIMDNGTEHMVSKNLGFYESHLFHHNFLRVHHSHLISLLHVKNYVRGEGGHIIMSDKSLVPVSRRKKEDFLRRLGL